MQLDFLARWRRLRATEKPASLLIGDQQVPLDLVPNPRARRYILRVRRDGSARVTIPRGGSTAFALEFAQKHSAWISRQLERRRAEASRSRAWPAGTEILFHGEKVPLMAGSEGDVALVRFAGETVTVAPGTTDFRPAVEQRLRARAEEELVPRTLQLAVQHQLEVRRVVVRNQRSRWGSCSAKKSISLNWRLIQAPAWVREYLILHELMHLREMNHSPRFWRLVQAACPDYPLAEAWLSAHAFLLR